MGAWGFKAWENDRGADWFDGMFRNTGLYEHLLETLHLDAHEFADDIRAAAFIVLLLSESFIWPAGCFVRLARLASDRMQEILDCGVYESPEFKRILLTEISRLNELKGQK